MFTTLACAVAMVFGAAPTDEPLQLQPIEKQIIQFTNAERAQYGLPEFEVDSALMETARQQATWMTTHHSLTHTNLPVNENIALGQPNAQEALDSWMHSPGHRANILNPNNRRLGVAAYQTDDGDIYWCQQFMP